MFPIRNISLGGGFTDFLFQPYLRKWSNLTCAYFSDGWEKTTRSAYCLGGFYRPSRSSDWKHFERSFCQQVSDDAKQLIRKLLEMKPTDRFTAEQAQHRSVDSRWNRVCYMSCLGRFLNITFQMALNDGTQTIFCYVYVVFKGGHSLQSPCQRANDDLFLRHA